MNLTITNTQTKLQNIFHCEEILVAKQNMLFSRGVLLGCLLAISPLLNHAADLPVIVGQSSPKGHAVQKTKSAELGSAKSEEQLAIQLFQKEKELIKSEQQLNKLEKEALAKNIPTHFNKPTTLPSHDYELIMKILATRSTCYNLHIEVCDLRKDICLDEINNIKRYTPLESIVKKQSETWQHEEKLVDKNKTILFRLIRQLDVDAKNIKSE